MKQTLFCTLGLLLFSGVSSSIPIASSQATPFQKSVLMAQANQCVSSFYTVRTQNGDALNVRHSPSMNAKVVGKLPYGTEVVVNLRDRSGQWAEVNTPKGMKSGWVAMRYLKQAAIGGESSDGSMRVRTLDGDRLNLRAQPTSNAKIISKLPNGSRVTVVANEGYWTKVKAANGIQGYVVNQYLVCE